MSRYYDWNATLSRDADITMVITSRGRGKTYGLRKQCIDDYLKRKYRFVEVARTKTERDVLMREYFDRTGEAYPDHEFKVEGKRAYIARKPEDGEKIAKDEWELIGYFVAMTELQLIKKLTFNRVKRIIMDEAIIERIDRYHKYLPYEWDALASIVDSCSRERADDPDRIKPKCYLLGNACDLINPWFRALGIDREPEHGYTWCAGKLALLHYEEPGEYEMAKATDTLSGRMLTLTGGGASSLANRFENANMDFIAPKTKAAKFGVGIVYGHDRFGIWHDKGEGWYFVTRKIPNGAGPVFALTSKDGRADMVVAKRAEPTFKMMVNLYYMGLVLYDAPYTRERFLEVLGLFGVR